MDPLFEYFKRGRTHISQNLYRSFAPKIKKYERFRQISLPEPIPIAKSYSAAVRKRHSFRTFENTELAFSDLSRILYWSAGILDEGTKAEVSRNAKSRRAHPSGGAEYPIEVYVFANTTKSLKRGVYHYRPDIHVLEQVVLLNQDEGDRILNGFGYKFVRTAPMIVFFTFVKERSVPKYGKLAYKLGLIEVGHISQNMYLTAAALGVGCCSVGGGDDQTIHQLLDLDGYNENFVSAVALGKKSK